MSDNYRCSDSMPKDSRIELVGSEVKALISDATKRSFLMSQNVASHSFNGVEKLDSASISSTTITKPLLPRRHFIDNSSSGDQYTNSKWKVMNENHYYPSSGVTSTSSTPSGLLSKVTIDDDMVTSASRNTWLDIADSSDSTYDDDSSQQQNWHHMKNHAEPFQKITETDKENIGKVHSDPAAAGDMSYVTSQTMRTATSSIESAGMLAKPQSSYPYSNSSVQSSYTVNEPTFSSLDSARAAGYPVITNSVGYDTDVASLKMANSYDAEIFASKNQSNNVSAINDSPQVEVDVSETQVAKNSDQHVEDQNVKYVQYTDLSSRFSQSDVVCAPAVQITNRFNKLVHDLEVVQLESVQHNALHHLDIAKAILLLKKAKQDLKTLQKTDKSQSGDCSHHFKSTPVTPVSEPTVQDLKESHKAILTHNSHKSVAPSKFSQTNTTGVASGAEDPKLDTTLTDFKVSFQPASPKSHLQKSSSTTFTIPSTSNEAAANLQHPAEHRQTEAATENEVSSRRNLFKVNGHSTNAPHDESVSYDSFSATVKASSSHSTPSKPSAMMSTVQENVESEDTPDKKNATGFVILDEKTPPGKLARKKEQFLLSRLKKEEEHRRNQMEREMEAEKRKQEAKEQQEKLLQKKQEEKEKRDKIFKDYQKRKRKEEKAAHVNHGIIGSNTPNSSKKTPKNNSHIIDHRVHGFGQSDTVDMGATLTIPISSRSHHGTPIQHHHFNEEDTDSLGSGGSSEYTGPKLYKQLQSKSNRTLITNAINHCCLSGKVNEKTREKTIRALEASEARHLMVLFRDNNCQFRALYAYHPDEEKLHKICGNGPSSIVPAMIEALFKYNSGRRAFTCVPSKTLSVSIDGITIRNALWQHGHSKK